MIQLQPTKDLQRLLRQKTNLVGVGAYDGMTGVLGQQAGFDFIWGSGFQIAASNALPDANILGLTDQLDRCRVIDAAVSVPVISDCDTGYGGLANAVYTVRAFEQAGISGVSIEDATFPKRCSFYANVDRGMVPISEHARKIRACAEARTNESFFIIARTEALVNGRTISETLERAYAYAEAGADAILIHSKAETPTEVLQVGRDWRSNTPLVAVPTTYDDTTISTLHECNYRIIIYANQVIRAAVRAIQNTLETIRRTGSAATVRDDIASLDTMFALTRVDELTELEERSRTDHMRT